MTNPQLVTADGKPLDADQIKTLRDWWSRLTRRRDAERELIYLQVAHTVLAETLQRERDRHAIEVRSWKNRLEVERDLSASLRARVVELEAPMKKPRRSGAKIKAT